MATPDARINPRKAPTSLMPGRVKDPELKNLAMKLGMASVNPDPRRARIPARARSPRRFPARASRSPGLAGVVAGLSMTSLSSATMPVESEAEDSTSPFARTSTLFVYSLSSSFSMMGTPPTSTQAWPRKGSTANPLHQVIDRRLSLAARATEIDRRRHP